MTLLEKINSRISELNKSLTSLQNNANAHIGAIQELERFKVELIKQSTEDLKEATSEQ